MNEKSKKRLILASQVKMLETKSIKEQLYLMNELDG